MSRRSGFEIFHRFKTVRGNGLELLTSNKSFMDWDEVFGDQVIATAILVRLRHHFTTPRP